jgi:D-alanyl-D-alanine carboxypeptidase (penicillin-binding protein 5/6)
MTARLSRFRAALCALIVALVGLGGVGLTGSTAYAGGTPVGGPLLTGRHVVVHHVAGVPPLPALDASGWLVADADTGAVLAAKAPHARYLPASTLKTLTAVTLIPLLNPDRMVLADYHDAVVDGSKVGIVPGMRYSVRKLFTAMLVVSGNDAADALAGAAGGTRHAVDLMNAEAQFLNADDTVAKTPTGLDAVGETTSAYDLALIARAGLQMPAFRHYVGTVRATMPAPHHRHFQMYTHNDLLTSFRGCIGVKNGYTVAADASYVGAATRGGHTIIITLLHAQPDFWTEAADLLRWGFAADGKLAPVGELVAPGAAPSSTPTPAPTATTIALGTARHSSQGFWPVTVLAFSTVVATGVTALRVRAVRRRPRRLSLPRF